MTKKIEDMWQKKAACKGPQSAMFFPPTTFERKDEKDERETNAKRVCAMCSVRSACLEYAVRIREPHGIWGGMNELERRHLGSRAAV